MIPAERNSDVLINDVTTSVGKLVKNKGHYLVQWKMSANWWFYFLNEKLKPLSI